MGRKLSPFCCVVPGRLTLPLQRTPTWAYRQRFVLLRSYLCDRPAAVSFELGSMGIRVSCIVRREGRSRRCSFFPLRRRRRRGEVTLVHATDLCHCSPTWPRFYDLSAFVPGTMGRKSKKKNSVKKGAASGDEKKEEEEEEDYVSLDGSWVAEFEDAEEELKEIMKSPGGARKRRGDALKVYRRLCRSQRPGDRRTDLVPAPGLFQRLNRRCSSDEADVDWPRLVLRRCFAALRNACIQRPHHDH